MSKSYISKNNRISHRIACNASIVNYCVELMTSLDALNSAVIISS